MSAADTEEALMRTVARVSPMWGKAHQVLPGQSLYLRETTAMPWPVQGLTVQYDFAVPEGVVWIILGYENTIQFKTYQVVFWKALS